MGWLRRLWQGLAAVRRHGRQQEAGIPGTPQEGSFAPPGLPDAVAAEPASNGLSNRRSNGPEDVELTPFAPRQEPEDAFAPPAAPAIPVVPAASAAPPASPDATPPADIPPWALDAPEADEPDTPGPLERLSLEQPVASPGVDEAAQVVVVFGAGRVAQEVARQAAHVGFAVDVLTVYPEEAAGRFPTARRVIACPDPARVTAIYPIDARHYAVVLTRSPETDLALLRLLLATPARYLGVMGTESEKEALFANLRAAGCPAAELACVRCPIGVPVGAQSPEELGIAIAAELVAARSGNLRPNRPGKR